MGPEVSQVIIVSLAIISAAVVASIFLVIRHRRIDRLSDQNHDRGHQGEGETTTAPSGQAFEPVDIKEVIAHDPNASDIRFTARNADGSTVALSVKRNPDKDR